MNGEQLQLDLGLPVQLELYPECEIISYIEVTPSPRVRLAVLAALESAPCWCCSAWGLTVAGKVLDQGAEPGWLCKRCADSSPTACNRRHLREANAAGIEKHPNDYVRGVFHDGA